MTYDRKKAAALRYDADAKKHPPQVSATGKGIVAENIVETAKANDVPIIKDPSLVECLAELNINESIPEELYEAVAEVFAFIYQLDQKIN